MSKMLMGCACAGTVLGGMYLHGDLSGGPFIVSHDHPKSRGHTATRLSCSSTGVAVIGIRSSTSVPAPGALSIDSEAADPY